jgi:hypothetical protein
VLLATVLLAAGLALAFATLGAATRTAQRGEAIAERSERIRAVEGFLRRRIAATRAVPFAFDSATSLPQRLSASPIACASSPTCRTISAAASVPARLYGRIGGHRRPHHPRAGAGAGRRAGRGAPAAPA